MQLSFSITSKFVFSAPAWFKPSKAIPAVIEPSPITAICCLFFLPFPFDAIAIPSAAEIEVEAWPTPKVS